VQRLLQAAGEPPGRRAARRRWSAWRQAHQARARRCHRARRARAHPPPAETPVVVATVPGTPPLTDAGWARVAALLPANGRRGGQWRGHRRVLGGILWVMRVGAAWRELPAAFGAWQTAYDRYSRWRRDGTWGRILAALLSQGEEDAD
jgi:hypothetical protein